MNLLILGRGKTGSLVAQVARERGHDVTLLGAADNVHAIALTTRKLVNVDAVIDFTTPQAVLGNIEACVGADKNMVVGTTGWYGDLERVRQLVEKTRPGFFMARISRSASICFSRPPAPQREYCNINIWATSSNATIRRRKTRLRELRQPCRRSSETHPMSTWKSPRSARAMWLVCMRSCWIRQMTRSIFVMTPNHAGDLPRARCGQPNGWLGKRASSISRIFGGRHKAVRRNPELLILSS